MKKIIIFILICTFCLLLLSGCQKNQEPLKNPAPTKEINIETTGAPQPTKKVVITPAPTNESTKKPAETLSPSTSPENEADPVDYTEIYAPLIREYYDFIVANDGDALIKDGFVGVHEIMGYAGIDAALNNIGYTITDLSGDGIPELMIVYYDENYTKSTQILAAYTRKENSSALVFEGWARNRSFLMNDGRIYNEGSNGAAYSIFGVYEFKEDGTELLCNDYYFTYEKDDTFTEIGVYHNTTGEWDKNASEELDILPEEFFRLQEDYLAQASVIEFAPFSEYQ